LAHDPGTIKKLESLLQRPVGLTLILGRSDEAKTFLFTAMGNSALRLKARIRICGLDLNAPISFSPVPGVFHCPTRLGTPKLQQIAAEVWPLIAGRRANLVLLNRVWSAAPELQPAIERLATEKHVILADDWDCGQVRQLRRIQPTPQALRIFPHQTHASWLRVQVENRPT
jgi:hypothetical protein